MRVHQLDAFDAQDAADVREPEAIFRRNGIDQMIRPSCARKSSGDLHHGVYDVIDGHEIKRRLFGPEDAERQLDRIAIRDSPAKPLERRPQGADKSINAVEMRDTS